MNRPVAALRYIGVSNLLALILLFDCSAAVVYGQGWTEQRCEEIHKRLALLEGRVEQRGGEEKVRSAPQIRKEIADKEEELRLLQSLQNGSQAIYLSPAINHVPLALVVVVGSLPGVTPELANMLVKRTGDLLSYVNKTEIRIRKTELPQLQAEQTEAAHQIFILREESESLSCLEKSAGGEALKRVIGEWQVAETGHFISIKEDGYGTLLKTMENHFGFKEGDTVLSDFRVTGDLIEAELVIRASKDDCPLLRPMTTRATISVQPGGKTFTLTAPNYAYCAIPCQWSDEKVGTLTRTFNRVTD